MSTRAWDPNAPLERGITLLEASAGTGKTWNIANLVLRLVVEEGVAIDRVVVVTFTKAATAELKERIRARLSDALAVVEDRAEPSDPSIAAVAERASGEDDPVTWRRLRAALEGFDACLVATIHSFCQRMLQLHAFESGADLDMEMLGDVRALGERAGIDLLTRQRFGGPGLADMAARFAVSAGCSKAGIDELARAALADPDAPFFEPFEPLSYPELVEAVAELAPRLDSLLVDLPDAVDQAIAGRVLGSRKRTYLAKTAVPFVAEVRAWLAAGPPAERFSLDPWTDLARIREHSVNPEQPFTHPAIDGLVALERLIDRAVESQRRDWARTLRADVAEQLKQQAALSYTDLLRGLSRRLGDEADPAEKRLLVEGIAQRFDVALIDEFQDTDAHQWTIFRELFGRRGAWLYLIGDPKQAIYGFRGANVNVYLQAAETALERRFTMTRNWRSDAALVRACNQLLGEPGFFGQSGIAYIEVDTPARQPASRLSVPQALGAAPLQLRWIDDEATPKGLGSGTLTPLIAGLVTAEIVALLESGARLLTEQGERVLSPGDIAVLVPGKAQVRAMAAALEEAGVPSVSAKSGSVFESAAASDFRQWLELLLDPRRDGLLRAVAASRWVGMSLDTLVALDDGEPAAAAAWESWLEQVRMMGERAQRSGVLAALRAGLSACESYPRVLGALGGERYLTDLLHVAELAHAEQQARRLKLEGALAWLADQLSHADERSAVGEQRLESDASAVQLVTVHSSKGLEYPVVFVPFPWTRKPSRFDTEKSPALVAHPTRPALRCLAVGGLVGTNSDLQQAQARQHERREVAMREEYARLLYVAFTRAANRLVVYGVHPGSSILRHASATPIQQLLLGQDADGCSALCRSAAKAGVDVVREVVADRVARWAAASDGAVALKFAHELRSPHGLRYRPPKAPVAALGVQPFARANLYASWRRHSYSALVRGRHSLGQESLTAADPRDHDALTDSLAQVHAVVDASEDPVPLADFPVGAQAGTALHEVLERLDFGVASLADEAAIAAIRVVVDEVLPRNGLGGDDNAAVLAAGLLPVLRTPFGGTVGGGASLRLQDLAQSDRLDELRFDLPVVGGSRFGLGPFQSEVSSTALVDAFGAGGDAAPAAWLADLRRHPVGAMAGFLTGSIDLVCRDASGRVHVIDYKSNRIVGRGQPIVPSAFSPLALAGEMAAHDYYLQAQLYLLAVHRTFRWRLGTAWDPARDLAGVHYLFVRGMNGQPGNGVWTAEPDLAALERLDRLFEGTQAVGGAA